ncbi:uncharacterized protein LOC106773479 [Vigna radiata var. radiata]|uniref:Uncharacterized protein LOC106773479 n=1 Tax=Vigna radiata var. radiata TaxID=3916 RepID=A0A1S3VBQ7_VIGRR|nr:uncharacterized protein LOC106773479 [Vigna radiata var. radiata]
MEINMRSEVKWGSSSGFLKGRIAIEVEEGHTDGLRELVKKMEITQKNAFRKEYGNLLSLGRIRADLRYTPLEGGTPYNYLGQYIHVLQLARIMKLHPMQLEGEFTVKGKVKGLPQGYLEQYLHRLAEMEKWETFMDLLALILFGVMLFPNIENFVDNAAINAFMGYKDRPENPVTAILAEVYGTLSQCYELKGGKLLCCLPVLYVWFVSRVSENTLNATCPVDELLQCKSNMKEANEWAQLCASLNVEQVKWNVLWMQRSQIIYYCGRYPNVPLMGIRCCINYNPALAQRQFGYPMRGSPTPASLAIL